MHEPTRLRRHVIEDASGGVPATGPYSTSSQQESEEIPPMEPQDSKERRGEVTERDGKAAEERREQTLSDEKLRAGSVAGGSTLDSEAAEEVGRAADRSETDEG